MHIDITTLPASLKTAAQLAAQIEAQGYNGLWTAETAHNPFLPLTLAAQATERITLGTQIAVAFARSPMTLANIAWDLQAQSDGRFILGLGTQVRTHIRKRFGLEWHPPVPRLREYIESLRAIWDTWQNGVPLRYQGDYYTFKLMTPFFDPGPIEYPRIPIYIAGVNARMCQLAGEAADGLHAHIFHTADYLRQVVLNSAESGLQNSNRQRGDFTLVVPVFTVTGQDQAELDTNIRKAKQRIAFYASTPSYAAVTDLHGWGATRERLSGMARRGEWDAMGDQITDTMLEAFAVVAAPDELDAKIRARYVGLADRVCYGWEA